MCHNIFRCKRESKVILIRKSIVRKTNTGDADLPRVVNIKDKKKVQGFRYLMNFEDVIGLQEKSYKGLDT